MLQTNQKPSPTLLLILVISGVLLLLNLDNQRMWQDEAQTALLGRTTLRHGVPIGRDRGHSIAQEDGAELDEHDRWRWHPWLPFYVVAASFGVLGESTYAARLPFALMGIATVAATYFLSLQLWKDGRAAIAAAVILSFSMVFLVLSRQCRYYSPAMLFSTLALLGYLRTTEAKRGGPMLTITAIILLFHSNFVCVYTMLPALGAHTVLYHRRNVKPIALTLVVAVLACAPFAFWFSGTTYTGRYGDVMFNASVWVYVTGIYLDSINRFLFPWLLVEIPVIAIAMAVMRSNKQPFGSGTLWYGVTLLLLFIASAIVLLGFVVPFPFFRYLIATVPVFAVLIGRLIMTVMDWNGVLGGIVTFLLVWHNGFVSFSEEYRFDCTGPVDGIVEYINENATEGDTVVITYADLPLLFYTPLRVYGGLTGEDFETTPTPDWIIARHVNVGGDKESETRTFISQHIEAAPYKRIELPYVDTAYQNREEPADRRFRRLVEGPPVVIWQRINE